MHKHDLFHESTRQVNDIATAPETAQTNILSQIQDDLIRIQEDSEVSADRAYLELCVRYLGFSLEQGVIADGKNDGGIDFLEYTPSGATILQAKSVDFTGRINPSTLAGVEHIADLPRIRNLFSSLDTIPKKMKASLRRAIVEIKSTILGGGTESDGFRIDVYFCFLGKGFTVAAQAEFDNLDSSVIEYGDQRIHVSYIPVFIPDLIEEKWRETNTKWSNSRNQRVEEFDFPICGSAIREAKSVIFFTKAAALVEAYREIGYQIFESNVRCEIKNSPVNKAIKSSIFSHRGRSEFKHLNNGTTIICDSFRIIGSTSSPTGFRVRHPGIINGLQTVKTIADAVGELNEKDNSHFKSNCEILVRLHAQNSVADYKDLVKSTNNQNPMKPRNLHSNDPEQKSYEKLFSDFGWFYERKEGAWNAFSSDPRRWSTLPNKKPTDFKNGKLIKKVDNEEIAQAWLAFIGYSEQAVDQKRYLFQEDKLYDLIFKFRVKKHGAAYNFRVNNDEIKAEADPKSPDPKGLLFAYLLREFAASAVKTRSENREESVKRLRIEKLSRNDQDQELSNDPDYLRGLILRGMLLLFVDFFGYLMFDAFGEGAYEQFDLMLKNRSIKRGVDTGDFSAVVTDYREGKFESDDVLLVLWEFYNHCVAQMISSSWLRQWRDTANRSKFIYGEPTRKPLIAEIVNAEQIFKRGMLVRVWTQKINDFGGVSAFLRSTIAISSL
jgi:AIPR protein